MGVDDLINVTVNSYKFSEDGFVLVFCCRLLKTSCKEFL